MVIPALWFEIGWTVWLATELVGAIIVPALRRGSAAERRRADRGSGFIIVLGVFVTLVAVSLFRSLGFASLPVGLGYVGIALLAVGIIVRQWAIAVLGRFFSTAVRILADQRVVEVGPYRYVRHPSYTGALVALAGLGVLGGSWQGLAVLLVASAVVFGYRIHVEEQLLREQLGSEYADYQARTKRLIPYLL